MSAHIVLGIVEDHRRMLLGGTVFTLDADFRIHRRHGNKVIPVLMPEA